MTKHILYVEDEESDAFLLQHSFHQIGLTDPFQLVTDGDQAIQYLSGEGLYADRQRFPMPCLILLDLNLPCKNGFEVLEWRRHHPVAGLIPVIIFTSSTNPEDIRRAYTLGAAAYIVKLPEPQKWTQRACAIRDFWLEQNTPPPPCQ
jgi:CheY-like chemotaxis protein